MLIDVEVYTLIKACREVFQVLFSNDRGLYNCSIEQHQPHTIASGENGDVSNGAFSRGSCQGFAHSRLGQNV